MGYVYLIEDNENALYKIGVTRGSVEKRIKELQTGSAQLLYIKNYFESDKPFMLERLLHNHHKDKHYNNEWYQLTLEDIDSFVDDCNKMTKIMKALEDNPFFH